MVEVRPQVVMTLTTTIKINGLLCGNGIKLFEISLCVGVERMIVVGAYMHNSTTYCLPNTHSYIKSLHN